MALTIAIGAGVVLGVPLVGYLGYRGITWAANTQLFQKISNCFKKCCCCFAKNEERQSSLSGRVSTFTDSIPNHSAARRKKTQRTRRQASLSTPIAQPVTPPPTFSTNKPINRITSVSLPITQSSERSETNEKQQTDSLPSPRRQASLSTLVTRTVTPPSTFSTNRPINLITSVSLPNNSLNSQVTQSSERSQANEKQPISLSDSLPSPRRQASLSTPIAQPVTPLNSQVAQNLDRDETGDLADLMQAEHLRKEEPKRDEEIQALRKTIKKLEEERADLIIEQNNILKELQNQDDKLKQMINQLSENVRSGSFQPAHLPKVSSLPLQSFIKYFNILRLVQEDIAAVDKELKEASSKLPDENSQLYFDTSEEEEEPSPETEIFQPTSVNELPSNFLKHEIDELLQKEEQAKKNQEINLDADFNNFLACYDAVKAKKEACVKAERNFDIVQRKAQKAAKDLEDTNLRLSSEQNNDEWRLKHSEAVNADNQAKRDLQNATIVFKEREQQHHETTKQLKKAVDCLVFTSKKSTRVEKAYNIIIREYRKRNEQVYLEVLSVVNLIMLCIDTQFVMDKERHAEKAFALYKQLDKDRQYFIANYLTKSKIDNVVERDEWMRKHITDDVASLLEVCKRSL